MIKKILKNIIICSFFPTVLLAKSKFFQEGINLYEK